MKEKRLFIVEFSNDEYSYNHTLIYVVADDYNAAAEKATVFIKYKMANERKDVLSEDGSLNNQKKKTPIITSIKIVNESILW